MEVKKELGSRINNALSMRGKKQKDLAEELGVTANTISYFCSGSRTPNIEQLVKISTFLDVTTDYLLGKTNDPDIVPTAADELGLSTDAICWIKRKSSDPIFGAEFCAMFSKLIETDDFQTLIDLLFDCIAATRAERIDMDIYENAYHANPDDIVERYKQYFKDIHAAADDDTLDLRVRLFVQANNEFNQLHEKSPVFASILGDGADSNASPKSIGIQGLAEGRANRQLAKVLENISETYGIPRG